METWKHFIKSKSVILSNCWNTHCDALLVESVIEPKLLLLVEFQVELAEYR